MTIYEFYPKVFQVNLGAVNCYLIDDNGLTLIDTGYPKDEGNLYKAIKHIGKNVADLKQIILTHLHPDHSGSAASLQNQLNIPVFMHAHDSILVGAGYCTRTDAMITPGFKNRFLFLLISLLAPKTIKPVKYITKIEEGKILPILSGAHIIHTPGHSKGHISLFFPGEKLLIAGDALVNTDGLQFAPLYENIDVAKESISKLAALDFERACFGHGKIIAEQAREIFNKFVNTF